jgi:hypothetical protein
MSTRANIRVRKRVDMHRERSISTAVCFNVLRNFVAFSVLRSDSHQKTAEGVGEKEALPGENQNIMVLYGCVLNLMQKPCRFSKH